MYKVLIPKSKDFQPYLRINSSKNAYIHLFKEIKQIENNIIYYAFMDKNNREILATLFDNNCDVLHNKNSILQYSSNSTVECIIKSCRKDLTIGMMYPGNTEEKGVYIRVNKKDINEKIIKDMYEIKQYDSNEEIKEIKREVERIEKERIQKEIEEEQQEIEKNKKNKFRLIRFKDLKLL